MDYEAVLPYNGNWIEFQNLSVNGEKYLKGFNVKAQSGAGEPILLIAPDEMQPKFLEILEKNTVNLGCSPEAASLCADKLLCTQRLKENGIPVAEIVSGPEPCEKGCHRYVVKPRMGCGSENVRISSFANAGPDDIVTRYYEGLSLSASFIVGERFCR